MGVVAIALVFIMVSGSSKSISSRCLRKLLFAGNNKSGLCSSKDVCDSSPPYIIIHRCKLRGFAIFAAINAGGIGRDVHFSRSGSVGVAIARSGSNSSVGIVVAGENSSKMVYVL
jgi:hypothetical protein